MSYIPKSVARSLQRDQRTRAVRQAALVAAAVQLVASGQAPSGNVPKRLDIAVDNISECSKYDVFFNGIRQTACRVADVEQGYIVRYKRARGRLMSGGEVERLEGKVEIRLR